MNIKPIETVYNGYKFRSRLEARWAVFFDSIGVEYQYEPEGFQLDDSSCYLPDFYIPEWDCYIEVKADRPNAVKELEKTVKFVRGTTNTVLILSNIPDGAEGLYWFPMIWFNSLTSEVLAYWVGLSWHDGEVYDEGAYLIKDFSTSRDTHPIHNLQYSSNLEEYGHRLFRYEPNSNMEWGCWQPDCESLFDLVEDKPTHATRFEFEYEINDGPKEILRKAYQKARQARFEHGETPII